MGLGIRYVLDLWVYRHRFDAQPDWDIVFEELRRAKIDRVAQTLILLSEHWFGNESQEELPQGLEEYILSSSLYGMTGQVALNNASLAGCRLRAISHHLFLTKEEYIKRYPWVAGRLYMLPVAWAVRIVHTLRHHGQQTVSWTNGLIGIQSDTLQNRRDMLKRIGF